MTAADPRRLLDLVLEAARAAPDPMELIELAAERLTSRGAPAPSPVRGRGRPEADDGPALALASGLIAEHVEPCKAILTAARKFAPGAVAAARHRISRKMRMRKLDKNPSRDGILSKGRV
jgi:hypothetical protein